MAVTFREIETEATDERIFQTISVDQNSDSDRAAEANIFTWKAELELEGSDVHWMIHPVDRLNKFPGCSNGGLTAEAPEDHVRQIRMKAPFELDVHPDHTTIHTVRPDYCEPCDGRNADLSHAPDQTQGDA